MKLACILAAAALHVACCGEITERVDGDKRTVSLLSHQYFSATYIDVSISVTVQRGQFPLYAAHIYATSPKPLGLNRYDSMVVYSGSNGFTFSANSPTRVGTTEDGQVSEFQYFTLTPVQMRSLCQGEVATFHLRGTRGWQMMTKPGELAAFFKAATNAAYAAARIKSPVTATSTSSATPPPATGEVKWKVVEADTRYWRISYRVELPVGLRRSVSVQFLDAQGFELASGYFSDQSGPATDTILIKAEIAPKITKAVYTLK